MSDIEFAIEEFWRKEPGDKTVELRVYNETSMFDGFSPSEKNHIGFIRMSVFDSEYKCEHLTKDREPITYKAWDACEFYSGR